MSDVFVVTAPYVTLRVRDIAGAWTVRGYYKDAVVRNDEVEPESLQHHLDGGMVAPVDAPSAPEPEKAAAEPVKAEEPKKATPAKRAASGS